MRTFSNYVLLLSLIVWHYAGPMDFCSVSENDTGESYDTDEFNQEIEGWVLDDSDDWAEEADECTVLANIIKPMPIIENLSDDDEEPLFQSLLRWEYLLKRYKNFVSLQKIHQDKESKDFLLLAYESKKYLEEKLLAFDNRKNRLSTMIDTAYKNSPEALVRLCIFSQLKGLLEKFALQGCKQSILHANTAASILLGDYQALEELDFCWDGKLIFLSNKEKALITKKNMLFDKLFEHENAYMDLV